MYVAQQERSSPLSPPPPMGSHLTTDRNGIGVMSNGIHGSGVHSYPTPSDNSNSTVPKMPSSPQEPVSSSHVEKGRIYSLEVVQPPVRARMCGFGDKDRRPITPPPCIKLVVKDAETMKDIDINDIDTTFFVLTVDLWSADGKKEVNLVRHSATSPSISAAVSSSYPPRPPTPPYHGNGTSAPNSAHLMHIQHPPPWNQGQISLPPQQSPTTPTHPAHYGYPQSQRNPYAPYAPSQPLPPPPPPVQYHQMPPQYHPQQGYPPQFQQPGYYPGPPMQGGGYYPQQHPNQGPLLTPDQMQPPSGQQPAGMFTRNLIGSLCVNAFKLSDCDGKAGIWFILQDLSVRTEGSFRLKMNFVNVGSPHASNTLNNGSAPVLASTFTKEFQVFSAKKFPGVIESTPLSKCFAVQGIKIPIRKDGPRGNVRDREEFEEDND